MFVYRVTTAIVIKDEDEVGAIKLPFVEFVVIASGSKKELKQQHTYDNVLQRYQQLQPYLTTVHNPAINAHCQSFMSFLYSPFLVLVLF